MNLIDQLQEKNSDNVNLQVLGWILQQPDYVIEASQKIKLIKELLYEQPISIDSFFTFYDRNYKFLEIKINQERYCILSSKLDIYIENGYYMNFCNFEALWVISDGEIDNTGIKRALYFISIKQIHSALSKTKITDTKTQYFIDEYLDFLRKQTDNN